MLRNVMVVCAALLSKRTGHFLLSTLCHVVMTFNLGVILLGGDVTTELEDNLFMSYSAFCTRELCC